MLTELRRLLATDIEPGRRLGYRLYAGHLFTVWGIALSNTLFGLTLLWSAFNPRYWRRDWPRHAPILVPLVLYSVALIVSTAFSSDPAHSSRHLREILSLATLVAALALVRGEREVRRIFDLLIFSTVLVAIYGIVQYYFTAYGELYNRIPGPFSHTMTLSGVLVIGDFLLLARMAIGDGWRRPWSWAGLVLINWCLMLSLTRGAWVAAVFTVTALLLIRGRRFLRLYGAVLLMIMLFAFFGPDAGFERLRSIGDLRDVSTYDRLCMVDAARYMISERPLFGIGPGMVKERYPIYRHPTAPRYTVPHLHNSFLELAAERGLVSLLAYLALMVTSGVAAFRGYRREGGPDGPRADLYLGAMLVLISFNLNGLFEDNWRDTEIQRLVLFLLAVPYALGEKDLVSRAESEG